MRALVHCFSSAALDKALQTPPSPPPPPPAPPSSPLTVRSGPPLRALEFRLGETPTDLWIAKTSPNQFRGVGLGAAVVFCRGLGAVV